MKLAFMAWTGCPEGELFFCCQHFGQFERIWLQLNAVVNGVDSKFLAGLNIAGHIYSLPNHDVIFQQIKFNDDIAERFTAGILSQPFNVLQTVLRFLEVLVTYRKLVDGRGHSCCTCHERCG